MAPLLAKLQRGERRITLHGLQGAARALVLSGLYQTSGVPMLVVSSSHKEALALYEDLLFCEQMLLPKGASAVSLFPPWEFPPYEHLSPGPELTAQRLEALHRLLYGEKLILVTSIQALLQRLIPRQVLDHTAELLSVEMDISRENITQTLVWGGYRTVDMVEGLGEYSVRGGIIDLWGPGFPQPARIELFGDRIESIRYFNPESQRSSGTVEEILILPSKEAVLTPKTAAALEKKISAREGDAKCKAELISSIHSGQIDLGLEQYMGFIYSQPETLADYLPKEALIVWDEPLYVEKRLAEFETQIQDAYTKNEHYFYPPPEMNYLNADRLSRKCSSHPLIYMSSLRLGKRAPAPIEFESRLLTSFWLILQSKREKQGLLEALSQELLSWQRRGEMIWLVCQTASQAQRLQELLQEYEVGTNIVDTGAVNHINPQEQIYFQSTEGVFSILIWVGHIQGGFHIPGLGLRVITEAEIFGEAKKPRPRRHIRSSRYLSTFSDLSVDDYVVHVDHGIGRYLGITKFTIDHRALDFLMIEYAGGDKLYVPLERISLVQKYLGGIEEDLELHRLGGQAWSRLKNSVKEHILSMAKELLELYATRKVASGFSFSQDSVWEKEFEATFEYEETPDQQLAINETKQDMESEKPMDRLICGDVGYGKTEVALRAACKTALDGKQVAVLTPTTVLAQQHYQTFSRRFASYPVVVEMLSRFRSPKERKSVVAGIRQGLVDIVIGTHRLLQKDIRFKDLGLVVIDEEQRFGVAHKEKLKSLRTEVDVLTLTATPIPRTLHLALSGFRDISIIDTPPEDRLEIHTEVVPFDERIIKEAVLRELERGGQVFFVHNRVETIEKMGRFLRKLLPDIEIAVAHGQMPETALEKVMMEFVAQKYQLLLCTTIIESGLDIPSANTIIINRADKFGLAQLYQLRGRVGRSARRAYAYLLLPRGKSLTDSAQKRLQAIQELSELGSGFRLAAHDLEIRGTGNMLGPEQHGHIAAVGFELYCQLLEDAVSEARGKPHLPNVETQIDLGMETRIPEDYISDTNQRLVMYKRISAAQDKAALERCAHELRDRYGRLPKSTKNLLEVMDLSFLTRELHIIKIQRQHNKISFSFAPATPLSPPQILQLVGTYHRSLRLTPESTLVCELPKGAEKNIIQELCQLLGAMKSLINNSSLR